MPTWDPENSRGRNEKPGWPREWSTCAVSPKASCNMVSMWSVTAVGKLFSHTLVDRPSLRAWILSGSAMDCSSWLVFAGFAFDGRRKLSKRDFRENLRLRLGLGLQNEVSGTLFVCGCRHEGALLAHADVSTMPSASPSAESISYVYGMTSSYRPSLSSSARSSAPRDKSSATRAGSVQGYSGRGALISPPPSVLPPIRSMSPLSTPRLALTMPTVEMRAAISSPTPQTEPRNSSSVPK